MMLGCCCFGICVRIQELRKNYIVNTQPRLLEKFLKSQARMHLEGLSLKVGLRSMNPAILNLESKPVIPISNLEVAAGCN